MSAAGGLALLLLLAPAAGPATSPAATPALAPAATRAPADPWAPLRPLLGEWVGEPSGRPGDPVASAASFELSLEGGVMVRRNRAELPPRAGEAKGAVHEDLMVIWPEAGALRATYWDNERHVIQYRVTTEAGGVVFESVPGPGPRFRLEYAPRPDGGLTVTFSFAPPGGELKPYVSGGAHRRGR